MLACLLHISQFLIIDGAGPVSSTVVGHLKTCVIIAIGSAYSGKPLADGSMIGILLAIGGIIACVELSPNVQRRSGILTPSQVLSGQYQDAEAVMVCSSLQTDTLSCSLHRFRIALLRQKRGRSYCQAVF